MTRKKAKNRIGFFHRIVFWLNAVAVVLLLVSYLARYVDPASFWPIAFLGLGYPLLLPVNLAFIVYWLFFRPVWALYSAVAVALGWSVLSASIGFRKTNYPSAATDSSVRIMTFNLHYFRTFDATDPSTPERDSMLALIGDQSPDILCVQEFMTRKTGKMNNLKTMKAVLPDANRYYVPSSDNSFESQGLAIFSKFPIVDTGSVLFPATERGNEVIFADLDIRGRKVRVYNVHLQSIGFQPEDYEYLKEVKEIKTDDVKPSKKIIYRLKQAFIKRGTQARLLKAHMDRSGLPVIVAGDFNDTPISYAVGTIGRGLVNAFKEKGSGLGRTYNGDFPNFQIDYIFASPGFKVSGYRITTKKLSDHFPVTAQFE